MVWCGGDTCCLSSGERRFLEFDINVISNSSFQDVHVISVLGVSLVISVAEQLSHEWRSSVFS